eukprot:949957-Pelagomonas_calceolata.AAC.2
MVGNGQAKASLPALVEVICLGADASEINPQQHLFPVSQADSRHGPQDYGGARTNTCFLSSAQNPCPVALFIVLDPIQFLTPKNLLQAYCKNYKLHGYGCNPSTPSLLVTT